MRSARLREGGVRNAAEEVGGQRGDGTKLAPCGREACVEAVADRYIAQVVDTCAVELGRVQRGMRDGEGACREGEETVSVGGWRWTQETHNDRPLAGS